MKSVEALLEAFDGYLELGMFPEALQELESLPLELQGHPSVQLARLVLLLEMEQWEEGARLGASLMEQWPEEHEFYFKTAFCLHELKRTAEAKHTLEAAPVTIREHALYQYNLACYETQLGNLEEAKALLQACFKRDARWREESLTDPDLAPLRKVWKTI